ncbi:MAG: hypothetical protein AAEJ52_20325 [Myxococcota bacterium]
MPTAKTNRLLVPGAVILILVVLLLLCYRGPSSQDSQPVAEQPVPVIEALPVPEEAVESLPIASVAGEPAEPTVAPVPVPVVEPEPVVPTPMPVAAAPAPVETAARPIETLPVVGAPGPAPVPDQDLLIADAAFRRFKPNVAAMALESLSVGTRIQGDESSLNLLQPCDTAASGCAAGLAPGQVVGTPNDWIGVVLPGF